MDITPWVDIGLSLIPLKRDKHTHLAGWKEFQYRQAARDEVEAWAAKYAPDLWGVVTGGVSNLIVLDFDGLSGQDTLLGLHLDPHIMTGSGGYHVWFEHPGFRVKTLNSKTKTSLGEGWPGLDIRADGGYAAFLGQNETGEYRHLRTLERCRLEILPQELRVVLGLVPPAPSAPQQVHFDCGPQKIDPKILVRKALELVGQGEGRNNAGFWLAIQLRDNGYALEEARSVGEGMYVPTLPATNTKGQAEEYTTREWGASIREAFSEPPRKPWEARGAASPQFPDREPGDGSEEAPGASPEPEKPKEKPNRFRLLSIPEIMELPEPEWLVDGIIPAGSLTCIYGPAGAGKSFLALDMSLSIACGLWWHGLRVMPRHVVYTLGEGTKGLKRRILAWMRQFTEQNPLLTMPCEFVASLAMPRLLLQGDLDEWARAFKDLPQHPGLIVVDTLSRALVGGDENSAQDMGRLVDVCDSVRRQTGGTVLLIHHTGKGGDIRGSSALLGAVDACYSVSAEDGDITLKCEKQKDSDRPKSLKFALEPVLLGKDANGEPISSCFITPNSHSSSRLLPPSLVVTLEAITSTSLDGEGLVTSQWLAVSNQSPTTFYRNVKQLVDRGCVTYRKEGRSIRYFVREGITPNSHITPN